MRMRRLGDKRLAAAIALVCTAVVVRLALPWLDVRSVHARATEATARIDTIRDAAERFIEEGGRWPAESAPGIVPPELVPLLPEGFSFEGDRYSLDWEHWPLPKGLPGDSTITNLVGVSMTTDWTEVGETTMGRLHGGSAFRVADTFTHVFSARREIR
jgi:hypothetical protein